MKLEMAQRGVGLLIFLGTFFYGNGPLWVLMPLAPLFWVFEWYAGFRLKEATGPYIFLFLSPLLLVNYIHLEDFIIRIICFLLLIFIICFIRTPYRQSFKIQLNRSGPAVIYLLSVGIFFVTASLFYFQDIHLSGDEPHYILIAQSVVDDGDMDLSNNMREKTYASFHPVEMKSHGIIRNGRILPFHMPGLSILLIPFYILYKWVFPFVPSHLFFRLAASLINGFFALGLFFLARRLFPKKNISGFWLFFIGTFPILFHAIHLYPELPAGALAIGAFYYGYLKKERLLLTGLCLSLVPWFHLKYAPLLLVLAGAILLQLLKKRQYREMAVFLLFPLLSFLSLEIYSGVLYGTFNPAGIFPSARYWTISYSLKLKTLFAYFLDQRDGLFLFAPVFFLAFMCSRRKREPRRILMVLGASYLLTHAFTTLRGAYSPAGRPLMFIVWIFIYFILNYHESLKDKPRILLKSLMGFGVFTTFWILYHPLFIYQPVYSHTISGESSLLNFFSGPLFHLPNIFPSFLSTTPLYDPANCLWIGILGMTVFFICNQVIRPKSTVVIKGFTTGIFIVLIVIFSLLPHTRLNHGDRISTGEYVFFNSSSNFRQTENKDSFILRYGQNYHLYFPYVQLETGNLKLSFSFANRTSITIRNGRRLLSQTFHTAANRHEMVLSRLTPFRLRDKKYAHLGIKISGKTDNRYLQLKISRAE